MHDQHVWSQTFSLGGYLLEPWTTPAAVRLRHIHYMGDIDNLAESFIEMILVANHSDTAAKGILADVGPVNVSTLDAIRTHFSTTRLHDSKGNGTKASVRIQGARTTALDQMVVASFAQDMQCFGYSIQPVQRSY